MAPMFYNDDEQIKRIADALEEIARQDKIGNMLIVNDGLFMAGAIDDDTYTDIVNALAVQVQNEEDDADGRREA